VSSLHVDHAFAKRQKKTRAPLLSCGPGKGLAPRVRVGGSGVLVVGGGWVPFSGLWSGSVRRWWPEIRTWLSCWGRRLADTDSE
jgi:hypothetical protein